MATWIEVGLLAFVGLLVLAGPLLARRGNSATRRLLCPPRDTNTLGAVLLVGAILLCHLMQRDVFPFAQWNMYIGAGHGTTIHTVAIATDAGPTAVAVDEFYSSLDHSRAHVVLRKLLAKSPGGRGPIREWLRTLAMRWQENTGRSARRVEIWASDAAAHGQTSAGRPPGRRVLWVNLR